MASSWNTGSLVERDDSAVDTAIASASRAVQEGKSLFQSVVDNAAEQLAQGAEVVSEIPQAVGEAAETVGQNIPDPLGALQEGAQAIGQAAFELLPEREDIVEDIKMTSEAITGGVTPSPETIVSTIMPVMDFAAPLLPINAEKFFEFMSNEGQIELTADDFSSSDVKAIKDAARKVLAEGRDRFLYPDWGIEEKSVLMKDLKTMASGTIGDPNFRMATLIGQTAKGNVRLNDQGELIVKDVYDFNSGPLGKKLQQALVYKEMGDMDKYEQLSQEVLLDEEGNPRPYFQRLRIWAAALGAPEGQGTEWEINLGKLD